MLVGVIVAIGKHYLILLAAKLSPLWADIERCSRLNTNNRSVTWTKQRTYNKPLIITVT